MYQSCTKDITKFLLVFVKSHILFIKSSFFVYHIKKMSGLTKLEKRYEELLEELLEEQKKLEKINEK